MYNYMLLDGNDIIEYIKIFKKIKEDKIKLEEELKDYTYEYTKLKKKIYENIDKQNENIVKYILSEDEELLNNLDIKKYKLEIADINNNINNINSKINSINYEYNNLELNIISFKDKYIKEIMDNQTLFNTCSICLSYNIPIINMSHKCCNPLELENDRKPKCNPDICLNCVEDYFHFDKTPFYGLIKCLLCPNKIHRPLNKYDSYIINYPLLKVMDRFYEEKSKLFKETYDLPLDRFAICNNYDCNMSFITLSDLWKHIRGEDGVSKCLYTNVICRLCGKYIKRKNMYNDEICNICDNTDF